MAHVRVERPEGRGHRAAADLTANIVEQANFEQIMFSEDRIRGKISVRALDQDPELGTMPVARWDFELDA